MSDQLNRYTVELTSVPGFYAQYTCPVDVWAEDDESAIEQAFRELRRGAFPDRSRDMWRVLSVSRKVQS